MLKIILGLILALFLFLVIGALSLFGCFRKKTPPKKDVESELELLFPGKFQVLNSNLKMLDVMAQLKGNKQAVIADKADQDIQFLLDWYKGTESAGFDSATVLAAYDRAKIEVAKARELVKSLKEKGLPNFSAGLSNSTVYLQVFAEPSPELRRQTLEILHSVLANKPELAGLTQVIELLEPEAYHQGYQDVIPATHWKTGAGMQGEMKILSLAVEADSKLKIPQLMRHWEINLGAKRLREAQDEAYKTAYAWAEKNLPKPFFMSAEGYVSFASLEDEEPSTRLGFPYYDKNFTDEEKLYSGNEAKGFVTGVYRFDQKVFTALRKQAEF